MASYEEAVKECETKVAQIVAECKRNNTKYNDPHFDLDDMYDCQRSLSARNAPSSGDGRPEEGNTTMFEVTQRGISTGGPVAVRDLQESSPRARELTGIVEQHPTRPALCE